MHSLVRLNNKILDKLITRTALAESQTQIIVSIVAKYFDVERSVIETAIFTNSFLN